MPFSGMASSGKTTAASGEASCGVPYFGMISEISSPREVIERGSAEQNSASSPDLAKGAASGVTRATRSPFLIGGNHLNGAPPNCQPNEKLVLTCRWDEEGAPPHALRREASMDYS